MKIAIAADWAGFPLKEAIKTFLVEKGHEVTDMGMVDPSERVTYIKGADAVAKAIQEGRAERGFLFCGTGMGMSIVANKHKGVYCALVESYWAARMSRIINNANVLAMGNSIVGASMAKEIADIFLNTEFTEGKPEIKQLLEDLTGEVRDFENSVL